MVLRLHKEDPYLENKSDRKSVYASYMGNEEGVSADNPDLVDAWDFEVKGDQPTQSATNTITGLKVPYGDISW